MIIEFSSRTRTNNLERLKSEPLDVLVIGGGIVGAGLIRDLALNGGIKAGLIEQNDFASGTSGASSQLIHGGFRYIAKRDLGLVKQSRKEREILIHIAPNLVKPIPLALLRYKGDPYPLAGIQLAARYYNRLSKSDIAERSLLLRDVDEIRAMVGPVATDTLKGCVVLWDSTVDDVRLTLATLQDAHRRGGIISNYVKFERFVAQPSNSNPLYRILAKDTLTEECFEISARKIVSTTGPWTDRLWCKDPSYDGNSRLVTKKAKGIHLILPSCLADESPNRYGVIILTQAEKSHNEKPRAIFVLPGEHDTSIIGTTETTPENEPESVRPSTSEVEYLLSEAQRVFPSKSFSRSSIIGTYAGVRPLIANNDAKHMSEGRNFVSREHLISESPSGILYVYGGKLTTHRLIAEETVDYLADYLNVHRVCKTAVEPLFDANVRKPYIGDKNIEGHPITDCKTSLLQEQDIERLCQRYGSHGYQVIQKYLSQDSSLAEPMTPSLPFMKAEILYSYWGEMAITLEDLLWRRTRIGWTHGQGLDIAPKIAEFLSERNNWNQSRVTAELERYRQHIQWLNVNL